MDRHGITIFLFFFFFFEFAVHLYLDIVKQYQYYLFFQAHDVLKQKNLEKPEGWIVVDSGI